jgi:drug/metabolite transporter (DMT)-like permease
LLVAALILDRPWHLQVSVSSLTAMTVMGAFCVGLVYVLYAFLIGRTGPTFASLSNYLIPVVGVLQGVIFAGDSLAHSDFFAIALIMIALLVGQFGTSSEPSLPPS